MISVPSASAGWRFSYRAVGILRICLDPPPIWAQLAGVSHAERWAERCCSSRRLWILRFWEISIMEPEVYFGQFNHYIQSSIFITAFITSSLHHISPFITYQPSSHITLHHHITLFTTKSPYHHITIFITHSTSPSSPSLPVRRTSQHGSPQDQSTIKTFTIEGSNYCHCTSGISNHGESI